MFSTTSWEIRLAILTNLEILLKTGCRTRARKSHLSRVEIDRSQKSKPHPIPNSLSLNAL